MYEVPFCVKFVYAYHFYASWFNLVHLLSNSSGLNKKTKGKQKTLIVKFINIAGPPAVVGRSFKIGFIRPSFRQSVSFLEIGLLVFSWNLAWC